MLATVCLEGVIGFSAQSGLVVVVKFFIAAVVAAIVAFLLKGHSQILLQQRSEESMKIDIPKKVQHTYEYATVCFSIWQSQIWRHNWSDIRIGWLIGESKRAWEGTWEPCSIERQYFEIETETDVQRVVDPWTRNAPPPEGGGVFNIVRPVWCRNPLWAGSTRGTTATASWAVIWPAGNNNQD